MTELLALLAGATVVALWISAWFVGESVFNRLAEPGFNDHADQALANSREREVSA